MFKVRSVAVWTFICSASPVLLGAGETTSILAESLLKSVTQDHARQVLEPHLESLKTLNSQVFDLAVKRNWWNLSKDIVARSHAQNVDLSVPVRKAVQNMKEEADELVRLLNPKYGIAHKVSPAFQWAQNLTCVFLTVKYTVRWNAPGALELANASVNISGHLFSLRGSGKHSSNKYIYSLNLSLFDYIDSTSSSWSFAASAKAGVTLRKKWPRVWPRLLSMKGLKVGDMRPDLDMQGKMASGAPSVLHSPVTCAVSEKNFYCLPTDSCRTAADCSDCPGKTIPDPKANLCAGVPTQKALLEFTDADMDPYELGGSIKIKGADGDLDVDSYVVYFGVDAITKLKLADGSDHIIGETKPAHGNSSIVFVQMNTRLPEGATHFLVYSSNEHGEHGIPGDTLITDAANPLAQPQGVSFLDVDSAKGVIGGTVEIESAEDETGNKIDHYSLHWGRSPTKKLPGASNQLASSVSKSHVITAQTIPAGAKYILAYSKNSFGEHPVPASLRIIDNAKPCANATDSDCVGAVYVTASASEITISLSPAEHEDSSEFQYALYWGKRSCSSVTPSCMWRQTGSCTSTGPREPKQDQICGDKIPKGSSGFCDYDGDEQLGDDEPGYACNELPDPASCSTISKEKVMKGASLIKNLSPTLAGDPLVLKRSHPESSVPEGTTHILVFPRNTMGESDYCVSTSFANDIDSPRSTPLESTQKTGTGE